MLRRLGRPWPAAVVTALALALALAGGGCGGGDSGTGATTTTGGGGSTMTPERAYTTALSQCQRIGAAALRANYQPQGGAGKAGDRKPVDVGLLAQVYVSQTTYFHPYEQQAIRGCEAGLRR